MSDVTLFHIWPSLCSQKVRLALEEKGVRYVSRLVNIGPQMENYEPWYVRINPHAVVPTLLHGDTVVTDSTRIVRYIAEAFAGPALVPADPDARRVMDAWIDRTDAIAFRTLSYAQPSAFRARLVRAAVGFRAHRLRTLAAKNPDLRAAYEAKLVDVLRWHADIVAPEAVAAARRDLLGSLDEAEKLLADGRPYLTGEAYSIADVVWTVALARAKTLGHDAWARGGTHPHLAGYYARMRARPSFAAASVWERVAPRQVAAIVLPFALPRLAAGAAALAVVWFAFARLLR